jgi:hypothetical protein
MGPVRLGVHRRLPGLVGPASVRTKWVRACVAQRIQGPSITRAGVPVVAGGRGEALEGARAAPRSTSRRGLEEEGESVERRARLG